MKMRLSTQGSIIKLIYKCIKILDEYQIDSSKHYD